MIPQCWDSNPSSALHPTQALGPFCDNGSVIMYVNIYF